MPAALVRVIALAILAVSMARAEGVTKSGHAVAHNGSNIYYEVHGTGPRFLLMGFQLQPGHPSVQAFVDGLGKDYKIIIASYPPGESNPNAGEAMMYTFTPAAVTRDYLEIANAAGADEFAYYGYSWGAVCGLQIALRSDRLKALVAGGFPMINGPYRQIQQTLHAIVFSEAKAKLPPESARQMLTYYEALQSFDDRAIQGRLEIPRLNFVGTRDHFTFPGNVEVEFYKRFSESNGELKAAGWDVISVPDRDHGSTTAPEVVVPLLRKWLAEKWPQDETRR